MPEQRRAGQLVYIYFIIIIKANLKIGSAWSSECQSHCFHSQSKMPDWGKMPLLRTLLELKSVQPGFIFQIFFEL